MSKEDIRVEGKGIRPCSLSTVLENYLSLNPRRFFRKPIEGIARAENKPSSVSLRSRRRRDQDDDHLSGSFVAKGLKRPTRKLPRQRRGRSGQLLLPYLVLLSGGVCPDPCYHGNGWSLTPPFHPWPSTGSGRSFFCGTFRPLRAHVLRGTLPWRARTFLPSTTLRAIIYSALATLTHLLATSFLNYANQ